MNTPPHTHPAGPAVRRPEANPAFPRRHFLRQLKTWAGWRNVGKGVFNDYGRLLVEQKFDEILQLIPKL